MGGGRSKSESKNVHNDNDIMAGDNAVVIGDGGQYVSKEVGMGATLLEAGATDQSDNSGVIIEGGGGFNSGVQLGDGSSLIASSMDEHTATLLDNAMTYMYANTENILELAAKNNGGENPDFMNPVKEEVVREADTSLSTGWKVGLAGALVLGGYAALRGVKTS